MGLHVSLDLIELDHLDKSIRFPLQDVTFLERTQAGTSSEQVASPARAENAPKPTKGMKTPRVSALCFFAAAGLSDRWRSHRVPVNDCPQIVPCSCHV
jgi:hypothetical protein